MGSVANNDSLLILLFWLVTPVILRLADGDVRARTAALAGLLTGLALYTKGFALVLPLWVLAALLVALRRLGRPHLRDLTVAGLTYSAMSFAFGGWWWIANLVHYGEPLPSRHTQLVPPDRERRAGLRQLLRGLGLGNLPAVLGRVRLVRRAHTRCGHQGSHAPSSSSLSSSACVRRDRVAGSPIGNRLLLAAPIILLVAVQFTLALRAYIQLGRMPGLQGRYWFGALAALAVIVALGLANLFRRGTRWLPLAVLAGAVAMNVLAVDTILGYYWAAPGSALTSQVRAAVAWAPLAGRGAGRRRGRGGRHRRRDDRPPGGDRPATRRRSAQRTGSRDVAAPPGRPCSRADGHPLSPWSDLVARQVPSARR